jgi:hypothetical protein
MFSRFSRRFTRAIAVGATALVIAGGAYGIVSATAGNSPVAATTTTTTTTSPAPRLGGGSNARSGPAAGGTTGTVNSVSKSSFALTTPAGQKVTVNKTSSTTYRKGTSSVSASAVKKGARVLVLGTVNGTSIAATQVTVQAAATTSSAAAVVPFQRGAPSTAKQVGQVPTNYTEGSGTIVSGTAANKATTAALASYPGGVIDRVVKLSNGEYEVHNIGVNWPHHIFVSTSFKVLGAD